MMKSVPRITKLQLHLKPAEEFSIIGIVSADPDYKLSLAINKKLKISLKSNEPVRIRDVNNNESAFSKFSFHDWETEITYNLFSNRNGQSYLIKKLKNIDYIFQIFHQDGDNGKTREIISILKDTPSATALFEIPLQDLKDKNLRYLIQ